MFIDKSMTRKVITIGPNSSLLEAKKKLEDNKIKHLPVVDERNVVIGIITDRDIRSAMPSQFSMFKEDPKEIERISNLTVEKVMSRDPITISPMQTLQDALLLIHKKNKGALPVVDGEGKLTGIISTRDLVRAFISVMGIEEPGTLLCVVVEDHPGHMKRIVDAITEEGISFGSILVARHWEGNKKAVFPYLYTLNVAKVKKKLEQMGYTLLNPMQWSLDRTPEDQRVQQSR
jgi:acetoin utilization protein AcuB